MKKAVFTFLSVVLLGSTGAHAGVLWQQLPNNLSLSWINQEFSDFPAFSAYPVNDVTVGPEGWQITSISEQFAAGGAWPSTFNVVLNIFSKSGPLPLVTDDPTAGSVQTATLVRGATDVVTVSGLNILLAPGDYWIGFTPQLDYGSNGQEFQLVAAQLGDFSAFRNPGDGFGFGNGWITSGTFGSGPDSDLAIEIDGNLAGAPEPGSIALLGGGMAAVIFARRRSIVR
jgi:hypothetical protein